MFRHSLHTSNDCCHEMPKLTSCQFLNLILCFAAVNAVRIKLQSSGQFDDKNSKIWREHESFCGGQHQSPINIDSSKAVRTNYPRFCFHNYDLIFPERLENNGHTVELKIEEQNLHAELPFITKGGLHDRYNFVQLHFHWGKKLFGSEHTINRKEFAGGLHIVHYNTKYGSFANAIPHEDGLAVLGILIELTDRDNIAFRHLEQFENIIDPSANNSDVLKFSVPLGDFLPRNTESFYRYNGSLTSGDCNEDVIWTVFDTPIAISERQLAKFRLLHDENGNTLSENVRQTQHLHDRVVAYRPKPKLLKPILLFPNIFTSFPNVFTPFPNVFTFYPAPVNYYTWNRMHFF